VSVGVSVGVSRRGEEMDRTYATNRGDGADRAATPRFIIA
jgi:hypothetical protein